MSDPRPPGSTPNATAADAHPLPGASLRSFARAALRIRGAALTTAGWRMEIDAPGGSAALVQAEHDRQHWLRGEGLCLGWPQARMAALWSALQPGGDEPELLQLG